MKVSAVLPLTLLCASVALAQEPPQRTSLSDSSPRYSTPDKSYVILRRGDVQAIVVNNDAVDDDNLPGHRAGYSGIASLTHARRDENVFVPNYAGLNYEHIHDGTVRDRKALFEPRNAPMQIRVIDKHTVDLYQPPTPTWGLESCLRYQILQDGTIEMTLECVPRRKTFSRGYIGLFWASYIHQPESLDIHFRGRTGGAPTGWIRGVTPRHGTDSTHVSTDDDRVFPHDDDFPLTLVFNRSKHRFTEPWYYGVSHGMALVYIFRTRDRMRLTQSPSGGGQGNPAWDFQYFVPDYQVGRRYQMVMRAMYVPFESAEQIERVSAPHREELSRSP